MSRGSFRAALRVWSYALLVWLNATKAPASPADLFGVGAESQALAGTGTAHIGGFAATHLNPARLSVAAERTLSFGYHAFVFDLELTDRAQHVNDAAQAAVLGLTLPLPLGGQLSDRLALGVSISSPGTKIASVRILGAQEAQFPMLAPRAETLNFDVAMGVRLPWGLSVGAGAKLLASLTGAVVIDAGASGRVNSVTDDELSLVAAPLFGVNWQATSHLDFGLTHRAELKSEFSLPVTVRDLGQIVVPPLNIAGIAQVDPSQWQFEMAYQTRRWRWVSGATVKRWSSVERFKESTVICPSSDKACKAPSEPKLGLQDTLTPRLALEWQLLLSESARGALRSGYFFEPSALPRQTTTSLFDSDRHAITMGYGVAMFEPWPLKVNAAIQHHWLTPRTHARFTQESSGSIWTFALDAGVVY
jgi:long-chain fatty acid transport protein